MKPNTITAGRSLSRAEIEELGRWYLEAEDIANTPKAQAMAKEQAARIQREFQRLVKRVSVEFTERDPYPNVEAMRQDIESNKRMFVYTAFSETPLWNEKINWMARAVHDWDHYVSGADFTMQGEIDAYRYTAARLPALAELYLSEIALQAAANNVIGQFPSGAQKLVAASERILQVGSMLKNPALSTDVPLASMLLASMDEREAMVHLAAKGVSLEDGVLVMAAARILRQETEPMQQQMAANAPQRTFEQRQAMAKEIGESNAACAISDAANYPTLQDSINLFYENAEDTAREQGLVDDDIYETFFHFNEYLMKRGLPLAHGEKYESNPEWWAQHGHLMEPNAGDIHAKVRDLPDTVQSALRSVNYGKSDILVQGAESVSPMGLGGSGYQEFVVIVNMDTGETKHMEGSWGGANMFNPSNQVDLDRTRYPVPPGVAVIKGRRGGGRPVYAALYLSPENLMRLLPSGPELDARDRWILYTFDGLTSAGRRDEWSRSGDVPSEGDLNRLAAAGYLKRSKNGATQITTEGKNALGRKAGQSVEHPKRGVSYESNAHWSTAYVNALPNSAFLLVRPDGTRKFPYRNKDGRVDKHHLANALARLAQEHTDVTQAERKRLTDKGHTIYEHEFGYAANAGGTPRRHVVGPDAENRSRPSAHGKMTYARPGDKMVPGWVEYAHYADVGQDAPEPMEALRGIPERNWRTIQHPSVDARLGRPWVREEEYIGSEGDFDYFIVPALPDDTRHMVYRQHAYAKTFNNNGAPPPLPPRSGHADTQRRMRRLVEGEERPFEPERDYGRETRGHHFAVNSEDPFPPGDPRHGRGLRSRSSHTGAIPLTEEQEEGAFDAGYEAASYLKTKGLLSKWHPDDAFVLVATTYPDHSGVKALHDRRVPAGISEDDPSFWEWVEAVMAGFNAFKKGSPEPRESWRRRAQELHSWLQDYDIDSGQMSVLADVMDEVERSRKAEWAQQLMDTIQNSIPGAQGVLRVDDSHGKFVALFVKPPEGHDETVLWNIRDGRFELVDVDSWLQWWEEEGR